MSVWICNECLKDHPTGQFEVNAISNFILSPCKICGGKFYDASMVGQRILEQILDARKDKGKK